VRSKTGKNYQASRSAVGRDAAATGRQGHNRPASSRRRSRKQQPPRQNPQQDTSLKPIKVSKSSIHSHWKKEIGGLIRYYINSSSHANPRQAEEEIERMYYRSGCSVEDTKNLILEALGVTKEIQNDCINIKMAIEKDGLVGQSPNDETLAPFSLTKDSKGVILSQSQQAGEGPAHCHEHWTNVVIPNWAIGKAFYFQLENNSSINLSCEIVLDGHQIARNAPLPGKSNRSVRPDTGRYFQAHKWILQPAKRVKFQPEATNMNNMVDAVSDARPGQLVDLNRDKLEDVPKRRTPRYNGTRPDYGVQRVSTESYPDPTSFGWTFTGGVEASRVEFFERPTNMGRVKLDWFYTTATVKTILEHPSTGRNQLFRNTVTSDQFVQIMTNPRVHTDRGYRRSGDRPMDNVVKDVDMEDEFDLLPNEQINGNENDNDNSSEVDTAMDMEDSSAPSADPAASSSTFFAKNEDYDFKTQGHMNRRTEMNKLHQSHQYEKWEEAAKKEYAVIHAKFYISLPTRKRQPPLSNVRSSNQGRGGGRRRRKNLEALPEQAPVVDIKAAENATLGTEYRATGPNQSRMRSNVRMDRIKGLTDDDEWKGGPLFERKLYYRAEEVISGSGMYTSSDDELDMEDEANDSNAASLRDSVSLGECKAEKISQVKQYHVENKAYNPEEAEELLHNCQNKIRLCSSIEDIDELVKIFYGELVKGEFYGNLQSGPVNVEYV